jgi:AraC family transcriptional regulator of adaptative response/methylated-DNA-[protein]-cysteine methyltransferase
MLRAFYRKDPEAQGIFLVGVKTTGIFCRPTCKARKPKPENVVFFSAPQDALLAGFRPCKLCQPMSSVRPVSPIVQTLRELVEKNPGERLTDKEIRALGVDPSTARRQFKRYYGMSFQAYHRARRLGAALSVVRSGGPVFDAQLDQGFVSDSGFRHAFNRFFGVPPSGAARRECLYVQRIETPLGTMLALANDRGLHLLDFLDRRGLERKLEQLRAKVGSPFVPAAHPILASAELQLAEYFEGRRQHFDLPLAYAGSPWETSVWRGLVRIAFGTTKAYSELAAEAGRPSAARAVGRANGMNFIAIVVPCHRVIRSDGALCGYGGGIWRKQWLIDHERRLVATDATRTAHAS